MKRLITAIINFFRGLFGIVSEKLEDDVRDGKFAIEDSKAQIADFRMKIAKLIAENKKMQRTLDLAKSKITKWQSIADTAGSKEDWTAAETALTNKANAVKEVNTLENEIKKTEAIIANLKKQLDIAQNKIGTAESNITRLAARKDAAEIRTGLAKAASGLQGDGPLASLDKLEQKVDASEAEAEALEEMAFSEGSETAELEAKYGAGSSDVSNELEALKAKFTKTE